MKQPIPVPIEFGAPRSMVQLLDAEGAARHLLRVAPEFARALAKALNRRQGTNAWQQSTLNSLQYNR